MLFGIQFEDLCGADMPVNVPGTWKEYPSNCQGTFVAEPRPNPPLTRPVYAAPKGCIFSGKPDQRFCDYTLADGTKRYVMLAQDIIDASIFVNSFHRSPPGYNRPDYARMALSAFNLGIGGGTPGVTHFTTGFDAPQDLPVGALACLNNAFVYAAIDAQGQKSAVAAKERFCYQPLPNGASRFVMLEVGEDRTTGPGDDARFDQDAAKIMGSLQLP